MADDLLAGFPVVVEQAVAWGDMDAYRHVNNVAYFRYFENARLEYLRRLDWGAFEPPAGVGPIMAATRAEFRKPLTYPDTIRVGARLARLEEDRITLAHRIVSLRRGDVTTEGEATLVSFDYVRGRKAPVPDAVLRRIEALEAGGPSA